MFRMRFANLRISFPPFLLFLIQREEGDFPRFHPGSEAVTVSSARKRRAAEGDTRTPRQTRAKG